MALEKYSDEQLKKMSMIELAALTLADTKEKMNFSDLFQKVAELKQLNNTEKEEKLASFYTDLNVDGRFMAMGSNVWALKRWYPVDQTTEKSLAESRKRDIEEELETEDELEFEEEEEDQTKELGSAAYDE